MNSTRHGGDSQSLGLSGMALADNNLSWSVRQGYATRNEGSSGSAELDYRGGYGEVDAGYARDRHSRRLSYGLSGALMAHRDGITLSQPLGETAALIKAPVSPARRSPTRPASAPTFVAIPRCPMSGHFG